jgi:hypothetical protein
MLSKVAHYSGFQSYKDLPYPSLKAGKKQLESNTVYQDTVRKDDELKFYNNTNRWTTLYDQNLSKTVQPEHYNNLPPKVNQQHFEKSLLAEAGKHLTLTDAQRTQGRLTGVAKPKEPFQPHDKGLQLYNKTVNSLKVEQGDLAKSHHQSKSVVVSPHAQEENNAGSEYLKTGTEHWKSTYVAGIKDPYSISRATRPEWTLHKPAYTVEGGPRTTESKGQFGDRGVNPIEKLSRTVLMPPVPKSEETLKLGTTQSTFHIPGYTGHLPKNLAVADTWDQALGVNTRVTYLKQNITENYQTRIPGYAGHCPKNAANDRGSLRQYCFSTAGERFH